MVMSLVKTLGVTLKDLMPTGQAHVVTLPGSPVPYQISKRLFDAARDVAKKEAVPVSKVFEQLLAEINSKEV
jgi:hypothetical protein